jgi:hypothetical protein
MLAVIEAGLRGIQKQELGLEQVVRQAEQLAQRLVERLVEQLLEGRSLMAE